MTGVRVSLGITDRVSLGKYSVAGLLGLGQLRYQRLEDPRAVFQSGCRSPRSRRRCAGFPFLRSLARTRCVPGCGFEPCRPVRGAGSLWLDLYFPDAEGWLTSSHVSVRRLDVFSGETSVHVFCPFLKWMMCFRSIEL